MLLLLVSVRLVRFFPARRGGVIKSDGHKKNRAPVRFCGAPQWSQSTAEAALVRPVESVSVSCLHPAATAHYSVEDDAGHHRVTKKQNKENHIRVEKLPEGVSPPLLILFFRWIFQIQ